MVKHKKIISAAFAVAAFSSLYGAPAVAAAPKKEAAAATVKTESVCTVSEDEEGVTATDANGRTYSISEAGIIDEDLPEGNDLSTYRLDIINNQAFAKIGDSWTAVVMGAEQKKRMLSCGCKVAKAELEAEQKNAQEGEDQGAEGSDAADGVKDEQKTALFYNRFCTGPGSLLPK